MIVSLLLVFFLLARVLESLVFGRIGIQRRVVGLGTGPSREC